MSGDGVNAMLLGDITVGTRRQYAEQSKSWTSGHKTEDELLQRIWNLSGDSLALADALAVTVAERDRLAKALQGVTLDLRMIQQSTPHDRGCDEPDDPTCAACVAASGLARLDEDALAAAGSGGNTEEGNE